MNILNAEIQRKQFLKFQKAKKASMQSGMNKLRNGGAMIFKHLQTHSNA